MNKNEFIETLKLSLNDFSENERNEILYDYEEHFRIGLQNGKTEEELIVELGDPKNIAKQYRATQTIDLAQAQPSTKNIFNAVFAAISLGLFNLIFIVGPFFGLVGVLIGLFASAVGVIVAGGGLIVATIAAPFIPQFVNIPVNVPEGVFAFYGIGTMALGILFFIGICYLAKYFYIGTIKYLRWNINVIKK